MHEMILSERVWSGTKSNPNRLHAFLSGVDASPACTRRIKSAGQTGLDTARSYYGSTGFTFCQSCQDEVLRMVNRRENSMQPSTGEGDHLPPAEQTDELGFPLVGTPAPVTPEVIQALDVIRTQPGRTSDETLALVLEAFDVLDDAGLFDRVDDAAMQSLSPGTLHAAMKLAGEDRTERPTDPNALAAWKNRMHMVHYGTIAAPPSLRLIQGGATLEPAECGKKDPRGYPCYLARGHSYDCMH